MDIAVGIAGSADVDLANVKALLNEWFGFGPEDADGYPIEPEDKSVTLFLPVSNDRLTDGLQTVLEWTDYSNTDYVALADPDDGSRRVDRVCKDAVDVLDVDGSLDEALIEVLLNEPADEKALILLWGEGDSDADYALLEAATEAGIPVFDLTGGMDDLHLKAPAAEPEPEPEEPRRSRRTKAQPEEQVTKDEPLTEPAEPRKKTRGRARQTTIEEQIEEAGVDLPHDTQGAPGQKDGPATYSLDEIIAVLTHGLSPTLKAAASPDRVVGIFEEPVAYLYFPDSNTYAKRGRGRIPAEAKPCWLTPSEVEFLGERIED